MAKVSKTKDIGAERARARALYELRMRAGLQMNPPFKGFGIAFLWFAIDEPELYKLIMMQDSPSRSLQEFIDTHVGFKDECVAALMESVKLNEKEAQTIYYELVPVALGLAFAIVSGSCPMNIREASGIIGKNFRAFLLEIRAGADERVDFVPREGEGPRGEIYSYTGPVNEDFRQHSHKMILHTLVSQNRLLQELHRSPRYVRDDEWGELERVLRNSYEITPQSLRSQYPVLTPGDIRLILLSLFQFSTGESAALLGISAPSVTKVRQRLKNKLASGDIRDFIDSL